jgi:hypothetical protein
MVGRGREGEESLRRVLTMECNYILRASIADVGFCRSIEFAKRLGDQANE